MCSACHELLSGFWIMTFSRQPNLDGVDAGGYLILVDTEAQATARTMRLSDGTLGVCPQHGYTLYCIFLFVCVFIFSETPSEENI